MRRQITSLIRPQMLLIQALGLLALGVLILVRPYAIEAVISRILAVALGLNAVLSIITLLSAPDEPGAEPLEEEFRPGLAARIGRSGRAFMNFLRAQERRPLIINIVLSLVLSAMITLFPQLISGSFGVGFGLWALLTGVVQFAYARQLHYTGSAGRLRYFLLSLISLLFGLALLVNPIARLINVRVVAVLYFIIMGLAMLLEFLRALFKWDMENSRILSHVCIHAPVMLTSFLPVWLLDRFNRMLERNNTDHIFEKPEPDAPPADISKNCLTILFHLGRNVALGYGHVDFALGDTVYSYGCYDDSSSRSMGFFSDGTFMVTGLKPYLDYCRRWQKKTLVSFTVRLTVDQERRLRSSLETTLAACRPWHPTERNSPAIGQSAHASSLIPIRYYKVTSGPFKIYSALKTNCVAMAEILVGQTGLRVLPSTGIITPGSYYAFLERQLKDPDSPVIRKTIYKINGRQPGADMSL